MPHCSTKWKNILTLAVTALNILSFPEKIPMNILAKTKTKVNVRNLKNTLEQKFLIYYVLQNLVINLSLGWYISLNPSTWTNMIDLVHELPQ